MCHRRFKYNCGEHIQRQSLVIKQPICGVNSTRTRWLENLKTVLLNQTISRGFRNATPFPDAKKRNGGELWPTGWPTYRSSSPTSSASSPFSSSKSSSSSLVSDSFFLASSSSRFFLASSSFSVFFFFSTSMRGFHVFSASSSAH